MTPGPVDASGIRVAKLDNNSPEAVSEVTFPTSSNRSLPTWTPIARNTFEEQDQPDRLCEFQETLKEITLRVESDHPDMITLWMLVRDENLSLKHDMKEICNRLNLDPTTGGPGYQRVSRMRKNLERVVESCRSDDPDDRAP